MTAREALKKLLEAIEAERKAFEQWEREPSNEELDDRHCVATANVYQCMREAWAVVRNEEAG